MHGYFVSISEGVQQDLRELRIYLIVMMGANGCDVTLIFKCQSFESFFVCDVIDEQFSGLEIETSLEFLLTTPTKAENMFSRQIIWFVMRYSEQERRRRMTRSDFGKFQIQNKFLEYIYISFVMLQLSPWHWFVTPQLKFSICIYLIHPVNK